MRLLHTAFFISLLALLAACGKKEEAPAYVGTTNGYFPVVLFAKDQLDTHLGAPIVISHVTTVNGKKDSIVQNTYNTDWGEVFKIFFATDITGEQFKDKYEFSQFSDASSDSRVLYYTAKDDHLFTRMMQVRIDPETNKILSLYIETDKKSFWKKESQKLYYVPMQLIQIQRMEDPLLGSTKNVREEYVFM